MRLLFWFTLLLLLNACAGRSLPLLLTPVDQQLFMQGMEELDASGDGSGSFDLLQERYPDSPWSSKARDIQNLLETIQGQQQKVKRLKASQTAIYTRNKRLQQRIESLEAERTKLRQLLIDLEQRDR